MRRTDVKEILGKFIQNKFETCHRALRELDYRIDTNA